MSPARVILAAVFACGALAAVLGQRLGQDPMLFAGIAAIGVAGVLVGLDTIRSRRLVTVARHDRRASETWVGAAAVGQGAVIAFTGLLLAAASGLALLGAGRAVAMFFVRHPGLPLLAFAGLCLAGAAAAIVGSVEEKQGERWLVLLNLAASRLLPGVVLVVLGLAAALLGLLEIVAPAAFDRLGGGFLEVLFGAVSR